MKLRFYRSLPAFLLPLLLLLAAACAPAAVPEPVDDERLPAAAAVADSAAAATAIPSIPAQPDTARTPEPAESNTAAAAPANPPAAGMPAAPAAVKPTATPPAPAEPAAPPAATVIPTIRPPNPESAPPPAAELAGISAWINSEPLTLQQLRGKVVLIDFWTYTCINCIRTFPYLKLWHSRYADDGLVILGIHTPEFEFEKDFANVRQATVDNGIVWPVAQDNDFATWDAYNNRYWPAKYLIDREGQVRYTHFGEGHYAETEGQIRELLTAAGADLSDDLELPSDQLLDPAFVNRADAFLTPELYAGYQRNVQSLLFGMDPYIIQMDYYQSSDQVVEFAAPELRQPHYIYFHGSWAVGPEQMTHGRVTEDYADYIALTYSAKSVNAVLTSYTGDDYQVRVTLEGEYLTEENRGADIRIAADGESYLLVNEPRLYEIVNSPAYTAEKELRLSSNSADFSLFAFTFGVYQDGP